MKSFVPILYFIVETSTQMGRTKLEWIKEIITESIADLAEIHLDAKIGLLEYSSESTWYTPNGPETLEDFYLDSLSPKGNVANLGDALNQLNIFLTKYHSAYAYSKLRFAPIFIFVSYLNPTDNITDPLKILKANRFFNSGIKVAMSFSSGSSKNAMANVVGTSEAVIDEKHLGTLFPNIFNKWIVLEDLPFDIDDCAEDNQPSSDEIRSEEAGCKIASLRDSLESHSAEKINDNHVLKNMIAYSEIWAILNLLEDSYSSRVPQHVKAFFEEERLKDYVPQIDIDTPLTEQNLQRETIVLLALLNVNYWCDSEEERQAYLMEMAKNDNKDYDPDDKSWDWSNLFDFSLEGDNNMKTDKELKIKIATGEISVTEKALTILRCQLAPCSPDQALDKCLIIKKGKDTSTVEVVNVGQDTVSVVYDLRCGSYTFELPNDTTILVNGEMDISYSDGKVIINNIEGYYPSGTVTLNYSNGEAFTLHMGDKVCSYVKNYCSSTLLLEYEVQDDGWDNEDWS